MLKLGHLTQLCYLKDKIIQKTIMETLQKINSNIYITLVKYIMSLLYWVIRIKIFILYNQILDQIFSQKYSDNLHK